MGNYLFGPYCEGALKTVIMSRFINGNISEQQIDFVKEIVSRYREAEIDNSSLKPEEKDTVKRQWKQWLDSTANGIKDELRALGKLK